MATAAWQTDDARVLAALQAFHPWAEGLLETRFKWRPSQPITILELRAFRLPAVHTLPGAPDHGGCTSWLALAPGGAVRKPAGAAPALDDGAWAQRQAAVRAALATLGNVVPIPLPGDAA